MRKTVPCLILLLINSHLSWVNSLLSAPWTVVIDAEHGGNDSFINCIGVLSSPTQVTAPSACIKQLPRNSQLLLKAQPLNQLYFQQTRLALRVSMTSNFATITVNPFELNKELQTLTHPVIERCIWTDFLDGFALGYDREIPNKVSVMNLNFTNSVAVCDELNLKDPVVSAYLHRCIRLSGAECVLLDKIGGEVLVTKSDSFGAFELDAFKLFHDCEQNVAVYSKICVV